MDYICFVDQQTSERIFYMPDWLVGRIFHRANFVCNQIEEPERKKGAYYKPGEY